MKKINLLVVSIAILSGCSSQPNSVTIVHQNSSNYGGSNIQAQVADVPGFDVNAFSQLLRGQANAAAIEQAINAPNNKVNNLDLDGDGNIDYLKVNQLDATTLQVIDETGSSLREVIATLTINPQNNSYAINGTPDYCGQNYSYASPAGITLGQFLFLHWMLTPHPYYHPYWGYHRGYYGGYSCYHSYYSRPYSRSYIQERRTYRTQSTYRSNTPNLGPRNTQSVRTQSAPSRSGLSSPIKSQRSFSIAPNNGATRSTSFGNRSGSSAPSRSSFGSSSSRSSSRSSFGGGGRRR